MHFPTALTLALFAAGVVAQSIPACLTPCFSPNNPSGESTTCAESNASCFCSDPNFFFCLGFICAQDNELTDANTFVLAECNINLGYAGGNSTSAPATSSPGLAPPSSTPPSSGSTGSPGSTGSTGSTGSPGSIGSTGKNAASCLTTASSVFYLAGAVISLALVA